MQQDSDQVNKDPSIDNGDKRNPDGTFAEGNKGGPGRPIGSVSITNLIREKLKQIPHGQRKAFAELIAEKIIDKAYNDGNESMLKEILDRIDGKAKQPIEIDANKESIDSLTSLLKQIGEHANQSPETKT